MNSDKLSRIEAMRLKEISGWSPVIGGLQVSQSVKGESPPTELIKRYSSYTDLKLGLKQRNNSNPLLQHSEPSSL